MSTQQTIPTTDINNKPNRKFKDYTKILLVDDKYNLQSQQITKVKSLLSQEVEFLIQKKEKQKEKRKRLQMMQQEFERKRKLKIQQLEQKIHQSQKVKSYKIKQKLQKNKRNLQQVTRVTEKVRHQYNQIMTKGLQNRKQFYSEQKKNHKALTSVSSKRHSIHKLLDQSELASSRTFNEIKTPRRHDVQLAMRSIEEKIQKAKKNHQTYKQQIVSKLYQKDRNFSQMKQKIISHSLMEEQKMLKQAYGKSENIAQASEKIKQMTEKHLSQRRRSFQQKIRKIHQNIKYLESQKEEKFASLENKFNKIYEPSMGNNRRGNLTQTNRQRVFLNHLKLQEEKKLKAEQILKKHVEITTKNKIYKEKKDQILQTINKSHTKQI